MPRIRRPDIADTEAALKAYYGTGYIGNSDIRAIFGITGSATINRLKKAVRAVEIERDIPAAVPFKINTKCAFDVWGIDVKELEKNRQKAKELGL